MQQMPQPSSSASPLQGGVARFGPRGPDPVKSTSRPARLQHGRLLMLAAALLCIAAPATVAADDWPEYRGAGRQGVWTETGILEEFPPGGLSFTWRVPIHDGYAGPAVAGGRVFVIDARSAGGGGMRMVERVLCLDEETGETLWSREWEADYAGLQPLYAIGPRATPTVDGDRVYVQGAMGRLLALDAATGAILWSKDYVADLGAEVPAWGMAGAPLVEGDLLICLAGAEPDGKVIAFDKHTGAEVWRALPSDWEPGYNAPVVFDAGGVRQLVVWHPRAITSLDPRTGEQYWEVPFDVRLGVTIASPVRGGPYLLVSSFFNGSRMLRLNLDRPDASLVWRSEDSNEVDTDKLHSMIGTPVIDGDYLYGIDSYGELRCIDVRTGERLWESQALTVERARQATAFFVRNGDRYFINNDRGELIIARFAPDGLEVVSRTHLLEPTSPVPRRRELGAVLWSYPAYANRHIVARNGREIVRASLAAR
ncbi:MAG: PQQ-binding-like beta-propeller repeat protein [Acidobacteria bacterium]|nr:PQQ-binding-like beta-propeller repeat protein [Acidobacteriota bacterium]